ncbi:TPA: hypothetical protein L4936_001601 [Pseudomonas aeruginosa]|nr:hypothetical protein [Pseudomonas aeruginosa]HBO7218655.1 hypothetical protein [Pseudomonas aeruginosa]HBO8004262.1 hypothetical protein [Pseudomonas aeruginosa]HDV6123046.1 hypothetical protein [Pseudomonas aeruginosa]HDV6143924.1 hypothetical protein [Pseudomonas aeruginosa]
MNQTHNFISTSAAYDATQCDQTVEKGHALHVIAEKVVGLAWTWPVAITLEAGALHCMGDTPDTVISDAGWTTEQIKHAVALADQRGYPVADWARKAAATPAIAH